MTNGLVLVMVGALVLAIVAGITYRQRQCETDGGTYVYTMGCSK